MSNLPGTSDSITNTAPPPSVAVDGAPTGVEPTSATSGGLVPTRNKPRRPRAHLYEIDVVRSVTAVCVVGVHAVAFTVFLTPPGAGQLAQNAVVSALHFTREIFLSITAFVMVYGYANSSFSIGAFWRKRGLGVLLPYIIWSVFYEVTSKPPLPPGQWIARLLDDVLTGNASFQLYFILLSLEFYLVLPLFLRLIVWAGKRPWLTFGVSFAIQIALLALDYSVIQTGPYASTPWALYIGQNESRWLPVYQFYMVFGGLAALYLPQVRAFMLRFGKWTILALAVGVALLWGNLIYQVYGSGQGIAYGVSVFQPAMAVYVFGAAAALYWLAYRWSVRRAPKPPGGYRFWSLLSDVSFGIYLLHAYILVKVMEYGVPLIPAWWLEPIRVLAVWGSAAALTVALCTLMLYIPGVSRLIGRTCALRRDSRTVRWLARLAAEIRDRGSHLWDRLAKSQKAVASSKPCSQQEQP